MLRVLEVQPRTFVCMLCGRLAEQSICLCCMARVRGEAIELKRGVEKKGRVETTRH